MHTSPPQDLTKVAPRSPYDHIGGYAVIARAIDKCRATIAGMNGEYHYDCPVDNMLFSFKGITGADFKSYVALGHTDDEIAAWVRSSGTPKTDAEVTSWSDAFKSDYSYANHSDAGTKAWFTGECVRLGLDPVKTTLFDYLDVDDKVSFDK